MCLFIDIFLIEVAKFTTLVYLYSMCILNVNKNPNVLLLSSILQGYSCHHTATHTKLLHCNNFLETTPLLLSNRAYIFPNYINLTTITKKGNYPKNYIL